MQNITILLLRGGSKSNPWKNLNYLSRNPLYSHVINAAVKTEKISNVRISSDCRELIDFIKSSHARYNDVYNRLRRQGFDIKCLENRAFNISNIDTI